MQNIKLEKIKRNKYLLLIALGTFLFAISSLVLYFKYSNLEQVKVIENTSIDNFFKEEIKEEQMNDDNSLTTNDVIDYIAILEIPKINLKRGLVDINSNYNDIKYNIQILKDSNMPDQENSNLILASHSGNSRVSYFRYLTSLSINDISYIYYNNIKYTYKVIDIYDVEKTGVITINSYNDNILTLITCRNNTNKQIVIISKLIDKEIY